MYQVFFFFDGEFEGKKNVGFQDGSGMELFSPGLRGKGSLSHEATMTPSDLPPPIFS